MALEVRRTGPLTTVQDLGRPGFGALGVGRSGAADRTSFCLANRLLGNRPGAAALETTLGGLELIAHQRVFVAVTGADLPVLTDRRSRGINNSFWICPGETLRLGVPERGLRNYVAVRGGIAVEEVLGSRSTDTHSKLGGDPLKPGQWLPVGVDTEAIPPIDYAPVAQRGGGAITACYELGPRDDWFTEDALRTLETAVWRVNPASNRIGVRLDGPPLTRSRPEELPSEGVAVGAIQVPPSGPIVFLDDHPVTGGYPVMGVVRRRSLDLVAQLRPGETVRFTRRG